MSESETQALILAWLRVQFPNAIMRRMPLGGVKHSGLAMKRNPLAGWPDLFMLMPPMGRFIGIEVKAARGVLSEMQKEVHAAIRKAGGEVYVVRSLEDMQSVMLR